MKIPFVDLHAQYLAHKQAIDSAIQNVIEKTDFIKGEDVKLFEQEFAKTYGSKYCIAVANGTDAIYAALKMLGIGIGDEVITVANSWISTSETIGQTGATPVFVDIDEYFGIDTTKIEQKITTKTKAIIPVHLYGQAVDILKVKEICQKHNLYLIEDCAQSHFATYNNKFVGTFGDLATFSFYPGKNLGAYGDAGAIITDNEELATKLRMYVSHGALVKHTHIIEGINSRLDTLQAAILRVKLPYIFEWNEKRYQNAQYFTRKLSKIKQISVPKERPNGKHIYHVYSIRAEKRNDLQTFLNESGISTAIHYPVPLPLMPAYKHLNYSENDIPVANKFKDEILSLPMYPELSEDMMDYIVAKIKEFYAHE